jgi:hypothetical protein
MFEGRRYIDFERQLEQEAKCLIYKPIPMGIANKLLDVPRGNNDFTGIKQAEKRDVMQSRPRNMLALANSLANVSNIPVQQVVEKLNKEVRMLVSESVNDAWDFLNEAEKEDDGMWARPRIVRSTSMSDIDTAEDSRQTMARQMLVGRVPMVFSEPRRSMGGRYSRIEREYAATHGLSNIEARRQMMLEAQQQQNVVREALEEYGGVGRDEL